MFSSCRPSSTRATNPTHRSYKGHEDAQNIVALQETSTWRMDEINLIQKVKNPPFPCATLPRNSFLGKERLSVQVFCGECTTRA